MEINLPSDFAERVLRHVDPKRGISSIDVLRQAMDRFEFASFQEQPKGEADLGSRFRRFRGMLGDLSREQMLRDRHEGLA